MQSRGLAYAGLILAAALAAGCGGDEDPVGALPAAAANNSNLAPASLTLAPVTGGSASASGTATDARLAEMVATAVLASIEGGNTGTVASLSGLAAGSSSSSSPAKATPTARRVRVRIPRIPAGLLRMSKSAQRTSSQVESSGPPNSTKPPLPVDPTTGQPPSGSGTATGGVVVQPAFPVDPGNSTPTQVPPSPGGNPSPPDNSGGSAPGSGGEPQSHPVFTLTPGGFRYQEGASVLNFHGAILTSDLQGNPTRIEISDPIRVEGSVESDGGSMAIDLTLSGVTGTVTPPANPGPNDSGPVFPLTFAQAVSLGGSIDRADFRVSVTGVAARIEALEEPSNVFRGRTLAVTASAHNIAGEIDSVSLRAQVRDLGIPGKDSNNGPTAGALWGHLEAAFTSTSQPYTRDNIQAVVCDVQQGEALSFGGQDRPVSGAASVEITHRDGRKSRIRVSVQGDTVQLTGTLAGSGGGTDRVETVIGGRTRVTGEAHLASGARESHEVVFDAPSAGPRQARAKSRISDAQGKEMVQVEWTVQEDRSGSGTWQDSRRSPPRRGRFDVDASGAVRLQDELGSELARAQVPRRGT
ncbi:MAG: hypothetical protein HY303_16380 [Candidatus Wallbacteria bacterium]|nr:hypothetical protein [Candidatus Wallbacteria bacterium]